MRPVAADAPAGTRLETHEALGDALAIVDRVSDVVLAATSVWCERVPGAREGARWSVASRHEPALRGLLEASPERRRLELDSGVVRATVRALDEGRVAVRLSADPVASGSMRDYMVSREFLFSRSRTISIAEMATTLAHEINQPIGTITNMLVGVRRRLAQPDVSVETMARALDKALEQARFAASVVARIRDFTQARRPCRETLDLSLVVRDAIDLLDWLFDASGCRIATTLPPDPVWVVGDETLLQQVAINLLRNGVDAMVETPVTNRLLRVSVEVDEDTAELRILDRGAGLADEGRSLFVAFASSKPDGMGVGLNICRSFVELHQGRIWLSPGEEGGCTSHVALPLGPAPARRTPADVPDGGARA